MEAPEGITGSHSSTSTDDCSRPNPTTIIKRKRTKRARAPIPTSPSPTSSTEEEDMANCLILLAQGRARSPDKFTSRRLAEAATTTGGKAGFYVYECKTCNKCFPSFQALGGHRASHKKPKPSDDMMTMNGIHVAHAVTKLPTGPSSSPTSGGRLRVHGCSICGAEFSSGQALGGHMRRHRPIVVGPVEESQQVMKKESGNSVFSLDLNLPAPCDEPTASFLFPTVASAKLVDCHY